VVDNLWHPTPDNAASVKAATSTDPRKETDHDHQATATELPEVQETIQLYTVESTPLKLTASDLACS
jgi:hypothetical protein